MQAHHEAVKDDVVDVKIKILESGVYLRNKKTIYLSSFLCLRTKLHLETFRTFSSCTLVALLLILQLPLFINQFK